MGLTTQVPQTIKVASKVKRVTTKIGKIQVKPVKSYVDVTNGNYYLLEILDALKDFQTIPDLDKKPAVILLKHEVSKLADSGRLKTVSCALQYPLRLGAILEFSGERGCKINCVKGF